jgi:hypothetical protein
MLAHRETELGEETTGPSHHAGGESSRRLR